MLFMGMDEEQSLPEVVPRLAAGGMSVLSDDSLADKGVGYVQCRASNTIIEQHVNKEDNM